MVEAAQSGVIDDCDVVRDERFNLDVPTSCPGVPDELLDARGAWADPAEYDRAAESSGPDVRRQRRGAPDQSMSSRGPRRRPEPARGGVGPEPPRSLSCGAPDRPGPSLCVGPPADSCGGGAWAARYVLGERQSFGGHMVWCVWTAVLAAMPYGRIVGPLIPGASEHSGLRACRHALCGDCSARVLPGTRVARLSARARVIVVRVGWVATAGLAAVEVYALVRGNAGLDTIEQIAFNDVMSLVEFVCVIAAVSCWASFVRGIELRAGKLPHALG